MKLKYIEVRDRATLIPVFAFRPSEPLSLATPGNEVEHFLLRRCGYARATRDIVMLGRLDGSGEARTDPYEWGGGSRTMRATHIELQKNWDAYPSGSVLDVEFVLGESAEAKTSEAYL